MYIVVDIPIGRHLNDVFPGFRHKSSIGSDICQFRYDNLTIPLKAEWKSCCKRSYIVRYQFIILYLIHSINGLVWRAGIEVPSYGIYSGDNVGVSIFKIQYTIFKVSSAYINENKSIKPDRCPENYIIIYFFRFASHCSYTNDTFPGCVLCRSV